MTTTMRTRRRKRAAGRAPELRQAAVVAATVWRTARAREREREMAVPQPAAGPALAEAATATQEATTATVRVVVVAAATAWALMGVGTGAGAAEETMTTRMKKRITRTTMLVLASLLECTPWASKAVAASTPRMAHVMRPADGMLLQPREESHKF
jgi:hypothetical protein